ncbi:MAG: hypothetical protein RL701_1114 [Pseudomonadota bacterium]|jgi:RNA polymerase sigma-70 factor (ECF subfamily)
MRHPAYKLAPDRSRDGELRAQDTVTCPELYQRLLLEAVRVTRSRAEAEDVVQDCFVKALESERDGHGPDNPRAWLTIAVRHRSIDAVRSRHRRQSKPCDVAAPLADTPSESDAFLSVAPEQLEHALQAIPAALRQLIELRYLQQLSYRELAERLRLSTETVGVRLHRARLLLRGTLTRRDAPAE